MKQKKTFGRRIWSCLLTLAMAVGTMSNMTLTAYADGHTHNFEYTASGDTITATCKNEGCSLTENKVTLTIGDPTNIYWDDKSSSHEFTLVGLEAFNSATGKTISVSDIVYYKGDNQSSDIKNNKVKGATYKARLTVEGARAEHSFTFTSKPIPHTHSFTYTANGAVLTATCTSTTGTCDLTNKQATLTLNAPLHTTYGDGKDANATLTGEIPGVTNPTIHYSKGSVTLGSAPTDAGTYTAWCQLGNATARVEYTINKATNLGWTTRPQAKQNLKYTGQPQALITAGAASAGNVLYTVGTDPDNEPDDTAGGRPYTSSVPEMTNAGTYYVWCKIDGGKNYTSINAQKVEVTIARADITPSVSIAGWTYGQTANTPMVGDTDNPGNGDVTYTYKAKDSDDDYSETVPSDAGDYTVKAVVAETENYNSGVATKDFTISKAALTVTAKDQNVSVGDEVPDLSDPVLDTHYTVAGLVGTDTLTTAPTLAYQKNGDAATPDNTALGTYDIVASGASAGDNYTISYTNGTLTVEKGKAVAATVTANNRTYDGTEKPLVTVDNSTLVGGEMWYALGENATTAPADNLYTTSIPTATDAGTYYVWYKVVGDEKHYDTAPACITASIAPVETRPEPDSKSTAKAVLAAKGIASGKTAAKISWNKVADADRYVIYLARCNYKGKTYSMKKVKTVSAKTLKWTKKKLKKNTAYRFYVVAQKKAGSKYETIAKSKTGHFFTGNSRGKYTNPKSLKLAKKTLTLEVGKSATIKGTVTKAKKGKKLATSHAKRLRFTSSDPGVATVNAKGKVTAKAKGTATIYVQTINGIWKTCKVTVR